MNDARPLVEQLLNDQSLRWGRGEKPLVEDYLLAHPELNGNDDGLLDLVNHEVLVREERGEAVVLDEYLRRFPRLAGPLRGMFEVHALLEAEPESVTRVPVDERATLPPAAPAGTPTSDAPARAVVLDVPGYEVVQELGRGGMGVVFLAWQRGASRLVALKMIRAGDAAEPSELARFRIEAEAVARLDHPNIVRIYEVGMHEGRPYFTLEYVKGGNLEQTLRGAPQPPRTAAALLEVLARAMHYAHDRGVVHRDLKPANVLLNEKGEPKVTDFGLAKKLDEQGATRTGIVMGTPSYMPPEQAEGKKDIGPAADVYALGAILYECLSGRPPFKAATTFDTLVQVVSQEPVPLRQLNAKVPVDLETICLKCLEKVPAKRYATAQDLADDLGRHLKGEPIRARPVGAIERAAKWVRRRPAIAGLLGALVTVVLLAFALVSWQLRQTKAALARAEYQQQQRALTQVGALRDAAPGSVPAILADLDANRETVLPYLRELHAETTDRGTRMRLALALLPSDPETWRDELVSWMLQADDPAEVRLVRDVLTPHAGVLKETLWRQAQDTNASLSARLRALSALAAFDPDNPAWKERGALAAEQMLQANPLHLAIWADAFRPVRQALRPTLTDVFRGKKLPESRQVAATVLAGYLANEPAQLAELLLDADERQFALLLPLLREKAEPASARLLHELTPGKPAKTEAAQEQQARRQALAALALWRLGQPERTWRLWRHTRTPETRSWLVARTAASDVKAREVIDRLGQEQDTSAKVALILALGEYTEKDLPAAQRQPLVKKLLGWYRDDADPGIHGAIDWLLRHSREGAEKRPLDWGQRQELERIDAELAQRARARTVALAAGRIGLAAGGRLLLFSPGEPAPVRAGRDRSPSWHVNGQGMTFTVIPGPVTFVMGSPDSEQGRQPVERQYWRRIDRTYALATKAVTVRQWQQFLKEGRMPLGHAEQFSPEESCPINGVNWYMAAAYCNWLSEKEGIPKEQWCYPEKIGEGMRMAAGYLKRTGYRLATEAEWEHACRAGAATSRYYGSSVALLGRHAWYQANSAGRTWPVGQKRPNDLGLFDLQGNMWTWCQEAYANYPRTLFAFAPATDKEDMSDVKEINSRVLRGGSYNSPPPYVRSSARISVPPSNRVYDIAFRVCRTYR